MTHFGQQYMSGSTSMPVASFSHILAYPPEFHLEKSVPQQLLPLLELTLIDRPKYKKEFKPSWTQLETGLPSQDLLEQPASTGKLYLCKKKK